MSITDELREYARALFRTKPNINPLTEIANRIDKSVAGEYVRLPVDADDVPIHVGDVMDGYDSEGARVEATVASALGIPCVDVEGNPVDVGAE